MAMCMTTYEDAQLMVNAMPPSAGNGSDISLTIIYAPVTIDLSNVVDNDDWETSPQHVNTVVRFDWNITTTELFGGGETTVESGSYSAPAAQALYNVPRLPSLTAPVVEVDIATVCAADADTIDCYECWAAATPFANAAALNGSIALVSADTVASMACYYFYYEVSLEAQRAGAVGVVYGESNNVQSSLVPVGVPYDATFNLSLIHI